MSATRDILQSYRAPRTVIRRHLERGVNEGRVLMFLIMACLMVFISQWPNVSRQAHLDPSIPLDMRLGGAMLGWLFIAPLFFYALSGVSYMVAKVFGGRGTAYGARLALFWSMLVVAPLWLLHGLVAGLIGAGLQLTLIGLLLSGAFFWVWINALIETQTQV